MSTLEKPKDIECEYIEVTHLRKFGGKSGNFAPSTHGSRFFVWKAFFDLFFALDSTDIVLCKNVKFLCFYATYKIG